jgi:tRNA guanosine-2'-O-methyltransferase
LPLLKLSLACRFGFIECICNSYIPLFPLGPDERLDAYGILYIYFSTLKSGYQVAVLGVGIVQEFDLKNVSEFWDDCAGDW